jgi:hypothetical protein
MAGRQAICYRDARMKTKKAKPATEAKTPGTRRAEKVRSRCNRLSDSERRALMDQAMQLFYGANVRAAGAHRR